MILFYVDESGDTNPHHEPLLDGETPLFCLSAVALPADRWRDYDRSVFALKRTYFRAEMAAYVAAVPGRRPEHFEIKGNDLIKPSHAGDRRRQIYMRKVLALCTRLNTKFFCAIWRKDSINPTNPQAIYTRSLQVLAERFQFHCVASGDDGMIVADSRTRHLDLQVAASHLSYVFGHNTGRTLTRLMEAPMFADSALSAGLQIADVVGAAIFANYYQRRCAGVPGHFVGTRPANLHDIGTRAATIQRVPARNYNHCVGLWATLDQMQFRRTDVNPPTLGNVVLGYYGYRELP